MGKLISIVVPIYNSEKFLSRCIDSIINQSYRNIEIILINDGSTDKSIDICNYYKSRDSRIIVIDKENEGVSATRNLGIKVSTGSYVGFVDSDDYIEKDMYKCMIEKIEENYSDICILSRYTINKYKNNSYTIEKKEALKFLLLMQFPTSLWAYLYSKELIKNIELDSEIDFFEDLEFNFRVIKKSQIISVCNLPLYNYNNNELSINNQQLNEKKLSCLKIEEKIKFDIKDDDYLDMNKYCMYTQAHIIVAMIVSLLKTKTYDEKYYLIIRDHTKKYTNVCIKSKYVPLKFKVIILAFIFNYNMLKKIYYIMKVKDITLKC